MKPFDRVLELECPACCGKGGDELERCGLCEGFGTKHRTELLEWTGADSVSELIGWILAEPEAFVERDGYVIGVDMLREWEAS